MPGTDDAQLGLFDSPGEEPGSQGEGSRGKNEGGPAATDSGAADAGSQPVREAHGADAPAARPAPPQSEPADQGSSRFVDGILPDQSARDRIREDLETNLLVEAGAGSGKTTALVERMVSLVETGTARVDEIAAVTFTRKAAAELRQRFQTELEGALAAARDGGAQDTVDRLDAALHALDRGFVGTIHSFCARLLRERPVEAGLAPDFREILGAEEVRRRRRFWYTHLDRVAATDDPLTAELARAGLSPTQLQSLFDELVANPDVTFPADPVEPPSLAEVAGVRDELDALLERAVTLLPSEVPEKGWDSLQKRVRSLLFLRRVSRWDDRAEFLDLLGEEVQGRDCRVTQYKWRDKGAAKALGQAWEAFKEGPVDQVLERWWAHRYPVAVAFARRAAEAFETERRRTGALNFQDLLMLAASLLRDHQGARRELGRRYRRILVDEFQDTDPVQAEVLMLLASPADDTPWQEAEPRPGALFVVGDPKQSIYRFRRADIAVYNLVRDRFREFGDVVELVANFRSLPVIGSLVDHVFGTDGRFGAAATPYQAAFAPLATRRVPGGGGIHTVELDPDGRGYHDAAVDGATRLVPWIAEEVARGRSPGDFMILARKRAELATYARVLEAWRVPVQVTGAGVDRTQELQELLVLLEALEDPTDPIRVVAVLVGLLFGLNLDRLTGWAMDGGSFDITRGEHDDSAVGRALNQLHDWWDASRREPADLVVGRILDESGLVPLAAARELGELRAGSLLFALDATRTAALQGDTSLAAATEALRIALDAEEAEAVLEPVRSDVVRAMTLHQAKGLEAPVVILVQPVGERSYPVSRHIERSADGSAVGHLVVQEPAGRNRNRVLARPEGWEDKEAEERRYESAEQDRLLYVAATRAEDSLVVNRIPGKEDKSPWEGLYPWIDENGSPLALSPRTPPEPRVLDVSAETLQDRVAALSERRRELGEPGFSVATVTALARRVQEEGEDIRALDPRDTPDSSFGGLSWGSAVHGALEAAARGARGAELQAVARSALLETGRALKDGEPEEVDALTALVEDVLESTLWRRAGEAQVVLSEIPFTVRDWGKGDEPDLLEGVVDLAFREEDGWVIADYKSDIEASPARLAKYRRQVELYARAWETATGESVKERILFFTARDPEERMESW